MVLVVLIPDTNLATNHPFEEMIPVQHKASKPFDGCSDASLSLLLWVMTGQAGSPPVVETIRLSIAGPIDRTGDAAGATPQFAQLRFLGFPSDVIRL
jgi:hypothetical protein